jgi:hypothetical protein
MAEAERPLKLTVPIGVPLIMALKEYTAGKMIESQIKNNPINT